MAPTGIAAFNIDRFTLHSLLDLPTRGYSKSNKVIANVYYIYCVSCLTAYLEISNHRLHHQHVIKQQLMTEPVIRMSTRGVNGHRLEQYILPPIDEVM